MTHRPDAMVSQLALRERAQALIQTQGVNPGSTKTASDALRVLFDLASSPATAPDALALLHELQVHQVELDLQTEELQRSRDELEFTWRHQTQLLDASPCALLVLDAGGCVLECNASGLKTLGLKLEQALGKRLEGLLATRDGARVHAWLEQASQSALGLGLALQLELQGQPVQALCAAARANPLAPGALVAWLVAPALG